MYLSYSEYKELGGTMDEATFNKNEFEIESKIDYLTNGRIKNLSQVPQAVKMLCFRLGTSFWEKVDIDAPNNLSSYSNGIESFGYVSTTTSQSSGTSVIDKQISNLVAEYLWEYPELVYRGRKQWKRKL